MIVHLVLAPKIEGAPVGEPFASVNLKERPLPGESLIVNGDAFRVIGRMIDVMFHQETRMDCLGGIHDVGDPVPVAEYSLLVAQVGRAAPKPSIITDPST